MSVNVSVCFGEEKDEMLLFGKVKTFPFQAYLQRFACFKIHILTLQEQKNVDPYALK